MRSLEGYGHQHKSPGVVTINLAQGVKPSVVHEITPTISQFLDQEYRQFVLNLERVSRLDSAVLGEVLRGIPS
jgi:hypothetical protein